MQKLFILIKSHWDASNDIKLCLFQSRDMLAPWTELKAFILGPGTLFPSLSLHSCLISFVIDVGLLWFVCVFVLT